MTTMQIIKKQSDIIYGHIKAVASAITEKDIQSTTRIINTIVLFVIMLLIADIWSIIKRQVPEISKSAASISSEMFDMNSVLTRYVMTGQIGDYVTNATGGK